MREYIFSFNFENHTINHYLAMFLKEHEMDYFYHCQTIYADLFGTDTYYKLEAEHVVKDSWDVYYIPEQTQERSGLERKYPLTERVLRVDYPRRTVKVTFADEDTLTTSICGHKDKIIDYYLNKNHLFNTGRESDNLQNAVKVEFIA